MHVYLYHGEEIKRAFFSRGKGKYDDVHNRLMEQYPEVPVRLSSYLLCW